MARKINRFCYIRIIRAPEQIGAIVRSIESLKADVKTRDLHKGDQIQIGKQFFEERKDAGALLIKAVKSGQYVGYTNIREAQRT